MNIWKITRISAGVALVAAAVLSGFNLVWPAIIALVIVGLLDIALAIKKGEKTLSQWFHKQFHKAIDVTIMIGLLIFTWFVFGPAGFLPIMLGVIMGHLFWYED